MLYLLCELIKRLLTGERCKCSPGLMPVVLFAALCMTVATAQADHSPALQIAPENASLIRGEAMYLHDQAGKLNLSLVQESEAAARFQALAQEKMFTLEPSDKLWIRLNIERLPSREEDWALWIPLPLVDVITLHYKDPQSQQWLKEIAGDRVAVDSWPQPGRYPRFHLDLPVGQSTVILEVRGSTPVSIPIFLGTEVQAQDSDRQGMLALGLTMGVLVSLVLICWVTAFTYRDKQYLLYGGYVLVLMLALMAYTGIAGYLLWSSSPRWADAAQGCLALVTIGGALYFMESILGGRQIAPKLAISLQVLAVASPVAALVYYFSPRNYGVVILAGFILVSASLGLYMASMAWRRGDRVGMWVFAAYFPLAVAVLVAVARAFGWLSISWVVQYGVVLALVFETPLMMVALNMRSRQRHELELRAETMSTQDPLTGLLTEQIFDDRVQRVTARFHKRKEDAGILLISLVNYNSIKSRHSEKIAEQSILRSVIKLRRVLRDVDTIARVGESQFGVILEGVRQRKQITELGARLIAQGLMPLPGMAPEVTLQYHIAALVLREAGDVRQHPKQELIGVLDEMSPRTRRPIRFVERQGGTDENASASKPQQPSQGLLDALDQESQLLEAQHRGRHANISAQLKRKIDQRSTEAGALHQSWSSSSVGSSGGSTMTDDSSGGLEQANFAQAAQQRYGH
jgi:two-component system, sensor histidine kinase LadS